MKINSLYCLDSIRDLLVEMSIKEAKSLWRLSRKARERGCSDGLVEYLNFEGWEVWSVRYNPGLLLNDGFSSKFVYAFRR